MDLPECSGRKHLPFLRELKRLLWGEHTSAEIADLFGIARGHLFEWLKALRKEGLEAFLDDGKPGPKAVSRRELSAAVVAELEAKLAVGEFVSAGVATALTE